MRHCLVGLLLRLVGLAGRLCASWYLVAGGLGLAGWPGPVRARPPATPPDSVAVLLEQAHQLGGSNLRRARQLAERALRLARPAGQPQQLSSCLHRLGVIEQFAGRNVLAQRYLEQALALARQARWPYGEANAYLGLGLVAYNQDDLRGALRWYPRADGAFAALPASAGTDSARLNQRLKMRVNLSSVYLELHRPDSAARICRQALALPGVGQHPSLASGLLQNLGEIQLAAHQPDSARATLRRGLHLARTASDSACLLVRLAAAHLDLRQPAVARQQALAALGIASRSGVVEDRSDALETLASALRALHRPEAFDTLKSYLALHDTLLANARTEAIAQAQARFSSREQQARIRDLEQQRRLEAQLADLRTQRTLAVAGGLAGLLLAVGVALLWHYRRRQQQREAALRQRLAADLHDDVGNLLTQVSLQADLLRETASLPAPQLARLQRLSDTSRQATRQMADVVRGLHASALTLPELLTQLREHAHEVSSAAGLAVDFGVAPEVPGLHLPPTTCQHLYLIFKESLHNVIKHAQDASQVTVRLSREGAGLCLRVQDDGRPSPAPPGRPGGHGLPSMRQRAEAVGGTLRLEPSAAGFAVVACLPV